MSDVADPKQAARAVWAAGDYDTVASRIWEVGERLVRRLGVEPDEDVLDVACGTGNAAIPAAVARGRVVGLDLTPELLPAARAHAEEAGVTVDWIEGDAEALPFDDESFDVVVSTFGAMFAPRHEVTAAELVRVLRPGGRLGLCSWTPEGHIGDFFRVVSKHAPPPPGSAPPPLWGTEEHVRALLADAVDLSFDRERVVFRFGSVDDGVDFYATKFGPVVTARQRLELEGRWPALRDDLAELFARGNEATDGGLTFAGEYLVVTGNRR